MQCAHAVFAVCTRSTLDVRTRSTVRRTRMRAWPTSCCSSRRPQPPPAAAVAAPEMIRILHCFWYFLTNILFTLLKQLGSCKYWSIWLRYYKFGAGMSTTAGSIYIFVDNIILNLNIYYYFCCDFYIQSIALYFWTNNYNCKMSNICVYFDMKVNYCIRSSCTCPDDAAFSTFEHILLTNIAYVFSLWKKWNLLNTLLFYFSSNGCFHTYNAWFRIVGRSVRFFTNYFMHIASIFRLSIELFTSLSLLCMFLIRSHDSYILSVLRT